MYNHSLQQTKAKTSIKCQVRLRVVPLLRGPYIARDAKENLVEKMAAQKLPLTHRISRATILLSRFSFASRAMD